MNDEGELKKRILDLACHGLDLVRLNETLRLLDEAKQDFPNWDDDVKYHDDWENERRETDTFAWFKKWFGSETTK
jgi:hypothetical protein